MSQALQKFPTSKSNKPVGDSRARLEFHIKLSDRDFALFVDAVENPKPVGARLKAAAEEFKVARQTHPGLNW